MKSAVYNQPVRMRGLYLVIFPHEEGTNVYFPAGSLAVAGSNPIIKLGSSYHLPSWQTKLCMSDSASVL